MACGDRQAGLLELEFGTQLTILYRSGRMLPMEGRFDQQPERIDILSRRLPNHTHEFYHTEQGSLFDTSTKVIFVHWHLNITGPCHWLGPFKMSDLWP